MKTQFAVLTVATLISASASAAVPQYTPVDHSPVWPLSAEVAKSAWVEYTTEKVTKLYSPKKWTFLTEVDGGFDKDNSCVVTARVTLVPFGTGLYRKDVIYKPKKTVATFGVTTKATKDQCRDMATAKLKEAISSMMVILATNP